MTELTLAVRLTADGENLVGAVRVSKAELEKFGKSATSANDEAARSAEAHGRAVKGTREQLRQTGTVLSSVTGAVKGLVAAWLSVATVRFVLTDMVREATKAERISANLNAVLRATGDSAGYTREQLDRLADSMARTTLFDDDTVRQGIAVMSTFRAVQGETFREAIELSADLAALMGGDLQSAILQMGRALQEPVEGVTALRRSGISFSQSQREMIKTLVETGRVAEAQKIILKEVAGQIGGAAGEQNQGLVKQVTDLTKAWDDFMESLGRSGPFIALISSLAQSLRTLSVVAGGPSGGEEWAGWSEEERIAYLRTGRRPDRGIGSANAAPIPAELTEAQRSTLRGLEQQTALIGRSALAEEQMKALRSAGFTPTVGADGQATVKDFEKLPGVFQEAVGDIKRMVAEISADAFGQRTAALQRSIDAAEALRVGRALGPDARAGIFGASQAAAVAAENRIVDPNQINLLQNLFTAQERANRELALTEELYEDLRGPQERYAERLRVIAREHASGGISAEEMRRATRAAHLDMLGASREWEDGVTRGVVRVLDEAGDAAKGFEELTVGAFRRGEDAWVSWARTGKLSAGDLFDFIEEQLIRVAYRALIVKPFLDPLEDMLGGWLKGLGGGSAAGSAGNAEYRMFGYEGHEGGVIGGPNAFRPRAVAASVFDSAPRFHAGGLVGGEVPIVAKRGEVVGWPEQMARAFGGGEVKIEVYDQRGAGAPAVETEETRGPGGQRIIRMTIRDEVNRGMNQGEYDGALGSNFGVSRAPTVRRG